jgi:plastocyanin
MKTLTATGSKRMTLTVAIILTLSGISNLHAKTFTVQFGGALGDVYSPSALNVSIGDTIQWIGSFAAHPMVSTTIPAGAASFSNKTGTSFIYVPTIAGVYNYDCQFHVSLGMTASFTVQTTTVDNSPASNVPGVFKLYQNYPNPFNPTTKISFQIPANSYTTLKIINIIGQEVATLVSETLPAGAYSRQWNASNMPSGFYFYRLDAGSTSETRKLVLLR